MRKNDQVLCFRATLEERRLIEAVAAGRQTSLSQFIREVLLAHARDELSTQLGIDRTELRSRQPSVGP